MKSAVFIFLVSISFASQAKEATSLAEVFSSGAAHINFRYRYEPVDQDGLSDDAEASTLRTRVNFVTGNYRGWQVFAEADNVSYVGSDDFNNTRNGNLSFPVVADPKGSQVNQLNISYSNADFEARLGRQRINLDNQRFVGGVGWRQNEQTYDALTLSSGAIADTRIKYTFIENVSRIFGPDNGNPAENFDSSSHIFNVKYSNKQAGNFSAYVYLLDFENAPAASNRTLGLRYARKFNADKFTLPLLLEVANQKDHGDNANSYSASYLLAELGLKYQKTQLIFGNERLGGSRQAGEAFVTPLATLHKFQGWADKFLATPAAGIDDRYLTFKQAFGKRVNLTLAYHNFESESGSTDYGTEYDVALSVKIHAHLSALFKVARYNSDGFSTDTTKSWLMLTVNF